LAGCLAIAYGLRDRRGNPLDELPAGSIRVVGMKQVPSGDDQMLDTLADGAQVFHVRANTEQELIYTVRLSGANEDPDLVRVVAPPGKGLFDVWVALQPIGSRVLGLSVSDKLKVSMTVRHTSEDGSFTESSDYRMVDNRLRGNRGTQILGVSKTFPLSEQRTYPLIQAGPALGDAEVFKNFGLTRPGSTQPTQCELVVAPARSDVG